MKQQTYIIVLKDSAGHTVNFERFGYKKLQTCIDKMIELYKSLKNYGFIQTELARTQKVIAYQTEYETSDNNKVFEIAIADFLKMIA